MKEILEKIQEAMLHLRTNYDVDGNSMKDSDAYQCLVEAELIINQMQLPVKPEIAEDKFKFAISVLNEIEGQMHKMENIEAKTFNRIMNFIIMRRNFLHKKQ